MIYELVMMENGEKILHGSMKISLSFGKVLSDVKYHRLSEKPQSSRCIRGRIEGSS